MKKYFGGLKKVFNFALVKQNVARKLIHKETSKQIN